MGGAIVSNDDGPNPSEQDPLLEQALLIENHAVGDPPRQCERYVPVVPADHDPFNLHRGGVRQCEPADDRGAQRRSEPQGDESNPGFGDINHAEPFGPDQEDRPERSRVEDPIARSFETVFHLFEHRPTLGFAQVPLPKSDTP